jgi:hypothetical protein
MADETNNPEKKIIVDEDWKRQVEAEREAMRGAPGQPQPPPRQPAENLPPASLSYLASTLYLQAAIALGILPNPMAEKKFDVHLDRAKHAIDTLQVLQEKTEGNRTPQESDEIEAMLHQLRLAFIEVREHGGMREEKG